MRLFKTYLLIIFCSITFSIFAFTIYKISIEKKLNPYPKEVIEIYKNKTGNEFDKRPRFKVYKDLSKYNSNVSVSILPESFLINKNYKIKKNIFPLSGVSNILTINCNENGYYSKYKSDRYGFNNPDEEWDKKNIDYLLLGDSFTHGFCVNRPNDIASILRNLSGKSVLNLGYGGNGPLIEYATLKEYLKPNIKNIIWFYYEGNDIENLRNELNSEILSKYLTSFNFTQNLKQRQDDVNFIVNDYLSFHYSKITRLYFLIKKWFNLSKMENGNEKKQDLVELLKHFSDIINFAKKVSIENNSNLFFVYLPEIDRYKKKNYKNNLYKEIKQIVEDSDIPFIDINKEVFKNESNPLELFPFKNFSHYTVEGYDKITKSIFKFVSSKK